jgi:hypothetical protein
MTLTVIRVLQRTCLVAFIACLITDWLYFLAMNIDDRFLFFTILGPTNLMRWWIFLAIAAAILAEIERALRRST